MQKVRVKKLEPADWVIAAGIIIPFGFDIIAWRKEWKTASVRFGEFLYDPKTRLLFVAAWGTITVHLFLRTPLPFQRRLKALATKGIILNEEVGPTNGDSIRGSIPLA